MRITFVLAVFLLMNCTPSETTEFAATNSSDLAIFADSLVNTSIDSAMVAGAGIYVLHKGQTLIRSAYGMAELEFDIPMPIDASFEIGSVTKQFTAAAILMLVKEGKLSLEDDFTKYVEYDTKGKKVSVNQLLNHTSGIPSYTELQEFWDLSIQRHDRDTLVRIIEKKDFLFEPGESLIYNNSAYFLLGLIIEKVSGMPYEDYLDENIFTPLGMNNTYYCDSHLVQKKKAYGYNYSPKGLFKKPYLVHLWPYAAGSLCSTVDDLSIWLKALHHGEILSEDLYAQMITPGQLNDGSPLRYAMGLSNFQSKGNHVISHGGGINGFLSDTRYYPEEDLYVIVLLNTAGPIDPGSISSKLVGKILKEKGIPKMELDVNPESYAGIYSGPARGRRLTLTVGSIDGKLILTPHEDESDTLDAYIGNSTWMNGNSLVKFTNGDLHIDQVGGYYILKKE